MLQKTLQLLKNKPMKKLILLAIITLVTSKSFSQTVTKTNVDTVVALKVPVAKLVIKDLLKGDGAVGEVIELNKVISLKDEQIGLFKQKDTLKDQKIGNLEFIISKKDQQFDLERQKSESLLKELKGQRRKTFLYKVGSFVGIIATSVLLLK
jgi:hypothetical protein